MSHVVMVCAIVMFITAAWSWLFYAEHGPCDVDCCSKHPRVIAGNQGIMVAAGLLLLVAALEHTL